MENKIIRGVTGVLAAIMIVIAISVLIWPDERLSNEQNGKIIAFSMSMFFIYTSMFFLMDAHIKYENAYSESMKRIHATSEKYAAFALAGSIGMFLFVIMWT